MAEVACRHRPAYPRRPQQRSWEARMDRKDRAQARTASKTEAVSSMPRASRRDVLRASGATALSAGATGFLASEAGAQSQNRDTETLERLVRAARDPRRKILIKGGTIITVDAGVGDFVRGDLLIEG